MLNLTSKDSAKTRQVSTELAQSGYETLRRDIELLRKHDSELTKMISLRKGKDVLTVAELSRGEFNWHPVVKEDFSKSKYLEKILAKVTAVKPENYAKLLSMEGVGPKTIRALSLVSEIIYGAVPSYEDPARYSFAHGGKDATPYPVDKHTYDITIEVLANAVRRSTIPPKEKDRALGRLYGI